MAPTSDLATERREILQALSHDEHALLVADSYLAWEVSMVLSEAGRVNNMEDRRGTLQHLVDLKEIHGVSAIRAVLEYSYLLYRAPDVRDIVKPFMEDVAAEACGDARLVDALIHEVERFSHSPYAITQDVLRPVMAALLRNPGVGSRLLDNEGLSFRTALAVIVLIVEKELVDEYPAILRFAIRICQGGRAADFEGKIRPLGEALRGLRMAGLSLLSPAYASGRLGKHGHTLLESFGDELCEWLQNEPPASSPRWARVMFFACVRTNRQKYRNALMRQLLQWASRSAKVSDLLRSLIERERDRNRNFFSTFARDVQGDAGAFVGPYRPPRTRQQVIEASGGPAAEWESFTHETGKRDSDGAAFGEAFGVAEPSARDRIAVLVEGSRGYFVRGFFGKALSADVFQSMSSDAQASLLQLHQIETYVTAKQMRALLAKGPQLDSSVRARLEDLAGQVTTAGNGADEDEVLR